MEFHENKKTTGPPVQVRKFFSRDMVRTPPAAQGGERDISLPQVTEWQTTWDVRTRGLKCGGHPSAPFIHSLQSSTQRAAKQKN